MGSRKKKITIHQQLELNAQTHEKHLLKEYKRLCEVDIDVPPPHRALKVGDRCVIGNIDYNKVIEVCNDGKIYKIMSINHSFPYGNPDNFCELRIWYRLWVDCDIYHNYEENPPTQDQFYTKNYIRINYYNSTIDCLLMQIYTDKGIDLNPSYQRDFVWTSYQREDLIHSIFNEVDIGKFTFVTNEWPYKYHLEIIDGKQRLLTLKMFFEDRFKYKGYYFSELHPIDKVKFMQFTVVRGETEYITYEQRLRYFLKLNTTGQPIEQKHLDNIYKMWLEEKDKIKGD